MDTRVEYDKHATFVAEYDEREGQTLHYAATRHMRLSGYYWGLTALRLLEPVSAKAREIFPAVCRQALEQVRKARHANGGYGGFEGEDAHLLYTLSAVQVHLLAGEPLTEDEKRATAAFVRGMQNEDGSFRGDEWGEVDTRFSYVALLTVRLLGLGFEEVGISVEKAVEFIDSCKNFDGGYGVCPGAESHGGQVFCCVGALCIANARSHIDAEKLSWWLAERQVLPAGGLNGRPEKLPDVCYSWWDLTALVLLGRKDWIDCELLYKFILEAQDVEGGGIADRPGDVPDVYHTYFGVAGMSLLGKAGVAPMDAALALPCSVLEANGIPLTPLPSNESGVASFDAFYALDRM